MPSNLTTSEITTLITSIKLSVDNAIASEEIMALLIEEGYTQEELEAGRTLADTLSSSQSATGSSLGAQKQATQTTDSDLAGARKAIIRFRTKARGLFSQSSSPEAWKSLQLDKDIPNSTNSLITFGYAMVDEAMNNESILTALSAKGYGKEKLESIRAAVQKAETSNSAQEQKKGGRKGSTTSRDEALDAAVGWWGTFRRTARQVLDNDQLTSLGLS